MSITEKDFDFWVKHNLNVLLEGDHGVGKTAIVLQTFERNNLRYRYFSCATMDPWIDFIGVPRETRENNSEPYLTMVRPKDFADDKIDAIFLDEYNRAPKKVRNAVMELIQFKSINGHKFKNLRVVWAAINPDDGNYDTEGMDAAQKDRFQIRLKMNNNPDRAYFAKKFGPDWSDAACSWWKNLADEIKKEVSPRRLDYALEIYKLGGNIRGVVLPEKSHVTKLIESLTNGPSERKFQEAFDSKDSAAMKTFLDNENNYEDVKKLLISTDAYVAFCLPLLSIEKQTSLINGNNRVEKIVFANSGKYNKLIQSLADYSLNEKLKTKARELITPQAAKPTSTAGTTDKAIPENPWKDQK